MMNRLVVLGCPRSGTSLVTNLLSKSGCDVDCHGAKRLMGKNPNFNPDGYFERVDIVRINDQLIRFYGKQYNFLNPPSRKQIFSPPILNEDILVEGHEETYKGLTSTIEVIRAKNAVESELNHSDNWVIKDSRLCYTLNFWKLKNINIIKVTRDPKSVKKSMENHYGNIFQEDTVYFRNLIKKIDFDNYYKTINSLIDTYISFHGGTTVNFENLKNGNFDEIEEFIGKPVNKDIFNEGYVRF